MSHALILRLLLILAFIAVMPGFAACAQFRALGSGKSQAYDANSRPKVDSLIESKAAAKAEIKTVKASASSGPELEEQSSLLIQKLEQQLAKHKSSKDLMISSRTLRALLTNQKTLLQVCKRLNGQLEAIKSVDMSGAKPSTAPQSIPSNTEPQMETQVQ